MDKVRLWREESFRKMGFSEITAKNLAITRIDLHEMQKLLDKGCPHHLALRIMRDE